MTENYIKLMGEFLEDYKKLECSKSLKIHSHFSFSSPNLGNLSDEHSECFH